MADQQAGRDLDNFRGMGRARSLLIAIANFRRRERGQRSPSLPPMVQWGRAGASGLIRRMVENCPGTNPEAWATLNLRGKRKG